MNASFNKQQCNLQQMQQEINNKKMILCDEKQQQKSKTQIQIYIILLLNKQSYIYHILSLPKKYINKHDCFRGLSLFMSRFSFNWCLYIWFSTLMTSWSACTIFANAVEFYSQWFSLKTLPKACKVFTATCEVIACMQKRSGNFWKIC